MRLFDIIFKVIFDWATWEERTRRRRNDDPMEAEMKLRSRFAGFSLLAALASTAAWGAMHFLVGDRPKDAIIAALHKVAEMATSAMGWFTLAIWLLTIIFITRQYTYDPSKDDF
jgi:hypothetical protein